MALGIVGLAGVATDRSTAEWTLWDTATIASAWAQDVLMVVVLATDNVTTTDGATNDHTSLTLGGKAFTKAHEFTNGQAAAAAGATVSIWYAVNDTGADIPTGSAFNIALAGAAPGNGAKALCRAIFSKGAGTTITHETTVNGSAVDAGGAGSLAISGLTSREHLAIRGYAGEGSTAGASTPTAGWSAFTAAGATTSGGGAATNIGARAECLISTATSYTSSFTAGMGGIDGASAIVALYEVAAGNNWTATPADALGVTDSVTVELGKAVAVNDPVAIADSPALVQAIVRQVDDAIAGADAATPAVGAARTLADPVAITDSASAVRILPVAVDDPIAIVDAVALGRAAVLAEALGLGDAPVFNIGLVLTEALALTDAPTVAKLKAQQIDDAVGLTDAQTPVVAAALALADTMGIADAASVSLDRLRALNDAVGITDNAAPAIILLVALNEALDVTDARAFVAGKVLALDEPLSVADLVEVSGSGIATFINFEGEFTLELDEFVWTLELADPSYTLELDETARTLELDDGNTWELDLDG